MYVVLSILSIFLVVVIHELAHAEAMRRHGIKIEKIGIGIPFPGLGPLIQFISRKRYPGAEVKINHLPLGAYVMPRDERELKNLPVGKQVEIYGASLLANFLLALVCCAVIVLMLNFPLAVKLKLEGVIFLVGLLSWFWRMGFYFLSPFASLGLTVWMVVASAKNAGDVIGNFGGPVTIAEMAVKNSNSPVDAVAWLGMISLLVALTNALPLLPFDGGRIINALMEHRWKREFATYQVGSYVLVMVMIFTALGNDLIKIIGWIF